MKSINFDDLGNEERLIFTPYYQLKFHYMKDAEIAKEFDKKL